MAEAPYTTDEDPFAAHWVPPQRQPRKRRSSLLDKWIMEQQQGQTPIQGAPESAEVALTTAGTRSNPYLAYPDLNSQLPQSVHSSAISLGSYDLIDDEDIPNAESSIPETPQPFGDKSTSTPSPFRSLHLSFRASSPPPPSSPASTVNPSSPRMLFFGTKSGLPFFREHSQQHNRSSSLGTLHLSQQHHRKTSEDITPTNSPSKWRPSVLGYFNASQTSVIPSETAYAPSRPSMSSGTTACASTTPPLPPVFIDPPPPATPTGKQSFVDTLRSRRRSQGSILSLGATKGAENLQAISSILSEDPTSSSRSRNSVGNAASIRAPFSQRSASRMANVDDADEDSEPKDTQKLPVKAKAAKTGPLQPQVAFSAPKESGTIPRVSLSTFGVKDRKKKRLIISGISPNDSKKFEGAKRWCESFGEVQQIIRMPKGDLHVEFKKADVADTVCRLRAKVYISGVGSVSLSWCNGNKR